MPAGVLLSDAGAYRRGGGTELGLLAVTSGVGLATKAEQAPTVTASTDKQRMMCLQPLSPLQVRATGLNTQQALRLNNDLAAIKALEATR